MLCDDCSDNDGGNEETMTRYDCDVCVRASAWMLQTHTRGCVQMHVFPSQEAGGQQVQCVAIYKDSHIYTVSSQEEACLL